MRWPSILLLVAGCSLGEAGVPPPPPPAPERGPDPPAAAPGFLARRLRLLGARELSRSILDVTGVAVPPAQVRPLDRRRKYDNGDPDAWVTPDVLAAIEATAWFVADEVVRGRPAAVFGACDDGASCKARIFEVVLRRLYRRDLSPAEQAALSELWAGAAPEEATEGVRVVLAAALQSPAFLYREEIGQPAAADELYVLEPAEIAAQLSFLVTGSTPDDELLAATRDRRLDRPDERVAQARRLLQTPAAPAIARRFLELFLATEEVADVAKSPSVYPEFRDGERLAADLDAMLGDVIRAGASTHELLSRPHALGAPIHATYAAGPPIAGVLMHPAFLAVHGGFDQSNPIERGLFVLTNLLCAPPPPPPVGIPRAPEEATPAMTTRQRFAAHTQGTCQACHAAIDGLGFGFEEFDGMGRFRTAENGIPIDASGVLPLEDGAVPYAGVAALSAQLATRQEVADCFGTHLTRFALGGGERREDAATYAALAAGSKPDTTYAERVLALVASDAFVRRRAP